MDKLISILFNRNFFGFTIGIVVLIVFSIIVGIFTSIGSCASQKKQIKQTKEYASETVAIRYYYDVDYSELGVPDYESAVIRYSRVHKEDGQLSVPMREGYVFNGYYSTPDFYPESLYADANGNIVRKLSNADERVILYPMFALSIN